MRKRKANPSSEWATCTTNLKLITEVPETVAVLGAPSGCSQPTVPQPGPEAPANRHPAQGADVATTEALTPPRIEGGVTTTNRETSCSRGTDWSQVTSSRIGI